MNIDTETLNLIDRIAPAEGPIVRPDAVAGVQAQLTEAENQLDDLAAAVNRADADIHALRIEQDALRILQEQRQQQASNGYLRGKTADTRELDKAIATLQANIERLRPKADGAIAARAELIPQLVRQRAVAEDLQSRLIQARAASGDPSVVAAYARDYERRVADQMNAGKAKLTSHEQSAQREAEQRNAVLAERQRQGFMSKFLGMLR